MPKRIYLKIPKSVRKHLRDLKRRLRKSLPEEKDKIKKEIEDIIRKYNPKK